MNSIFKCLYYSSDVLSRVAYYTGINVANSKVFGISNPKAVFAYYVTSYALNIFFFNPYGIKIRDAYLLDIGIHLLSQKVAKWYCAPPPKGPGDVAPAVSNESIKIKEFFQLHLFEIIEEHGICIALKVLELVIDRELITYSFGGSIPYNEKSLEDLLPTKYLG